LLGSAEMEGREHVVNYREILVENHEVSDLLGQKEAAKSYQMI